jgi:hypothetical protein
MLLMAVTGARFLLEALRLDVGDGNMAGRVRPRSTSSGYRSGTNAAIVATGLLLLASARGAWRELKGHGPMVGGSQQWPKLPRAVTASIAAWTVITLFILAWWSPMLWRHVRMQADARNTPASASPTQPGSSGATHWPAHSGHP